MAPLLLSIICPCGALFLLLFPVGVPPAQAQDLQSFLNPRYIDCLRNSTAPLPATFLRDLNATLLNFTTLSSQGVAYAATPSAMFQCRGDLSPQSCSACVANVSAQLPLACPASVGARLGTEACLLRYDNQSFFDLDTNVVAAYCNAANTSDIVALTAISDVMQNVTSEAPEKGNLFAEASERGVYAAAQCWGYLNQAQCSECLSAVPYRRLCDSKLGGQTHLGSCMYRFENYDFLDVSTPSSPPPLPVSAPTPPLSPPSAAGPNAGLIVGSVLGGIAAVVVALCGIILWCHKANRIKGIKYVHRSASLPCELLPRRAHVFSLKEMMEATANFDPRNRLGEGGFGVVFKGTLSSGEEVAIKKLSVRIHGKEDFLNEVDLLTSVQHKNLIRLMGCCVESSERILVYEYMQNKSLDDFLSSQKSKKLTWSARFNIIIGMARGLAYLHEESCVRIIHRDIKPGNVLLDDQLHPIIADFGLARLVKEDVTHINTAVAGTIGYLAPEYAVHGALSDKVDVYSFGLVCLEVVTGKKNAHGVLLAWVWKKYQDGLVLDVVDERLGHVFSPEQVVRVVHIALLCTQENPKQRPPISTIILWLSGMSDSLEIPSRPTFLNYGEPVPPLPYGFSQASSTSWTSSGSAVQFSRVSGGARSSDAR